MGGSITSQGVVEGEKKSCIRKESRMGKMWKTQLGDPNMIGEVTRYRSFNFEVSFYK